MIQSFRNLLQDVPELLQTVHGVCAINSKTGAEEEDKKEEAERKSDAVRCMEVGDQLNLSGEELEALIGADHVQGVLAAGRALALALASDVVGGVGDSSRARDLLVAPHVGPAPSPRV